MVDADDPRPRGQTLGSRGIAPPPSESQNLDAFGGEALVDIVAQRLESGDPHLVAAVQRLIDLLGCKVQAHLVVDHRRPVRQAAERVRSGDQPRNRVLAPADLRQFLFPGATGALRQGRCGGRQGSH